MNVNGTHDFFLFLARSLIGELDSFKFIYAWKFAIDILPHRLHFIKLAFTR